MILGLFALVALGVVPVGTQLQPLVMNTNSGVAFIGASNGALSLTFTNNVIVGSNASLRVNAGSTFTNDGNSFLSNTTVRGDIAFPGVYVALTSLTNSDYSVAGTAFLMVTNTTQNNLFFSGFAGGRSGQRLLVVNNTLTNMCFIDGSTLSTISNRIDLMGLVAATTWTNTVGQGSAEFIFDASAASNGWKILNVHY